MTILMRMMTILTRQFGFAMLGLFAGATGQAGAGVILQNQAEFYANSTLVSTATFDEFAPGTVFYTDSVKIDGVSYTTDQISPGDPLWTIGSHIGSVGFVSPPNGFGASLIGEVRIDFGNGGHVNIFGFDFLSSAAFPQLYSFGVTEIDGVTTSFAINSGQPSVFVGFTSDKGISGVAVANVDPNTQYNYSFDNVGRSAITAVPEPSTFVMAGTGVLVAFGCAWRRRKRAA